MIKPKDQGRSRGRGRKHADALPRRRRALRRLDEATNAPAAVATSEDLIETSLSHVLENVWAFFDAAEKQHVKILRQFRDLCGEVRLARLCRPALDDRASHGREAA